ncbi:MAG: glycosyltransferase family 2 protein [Hyphomonas sp.]|nr:glycosyltransferase family 2 protein [Hyphomonas sp.]
MEQVTLIIPCYNAADTITRTIESALAQTVPVRIIVIDDCSTDKSFEIVTRLAGQNPQLTVHRQARNGGPGAARNAGLRLAETPWVTGLDSDDFLLADRTARLLAHAEGKDLDFLADDIIRIWPGQKVEDGVRVWKDEPVGAVAIDLARFVRENTLKHAGYRREMGYLKPMMRTDFLRRHGLLFREDMRLSEDYDFYARALVAGARFEVIDPCGYIALNREGSLSKAIPTQAMQKVVEVDRALLSTPGIDASARAALREHLTQTCTDLAWMRLIDAVRARNLPSALRVFGNPLSVSGRIAVRLVKHALRIPLYPEGPGEGRTAVPALKVN